MSIERQPEFVNLKHTEELYKACNALIQRTMTHNLTAFSDVYGHFEQVTGDVVAAAIEEHCKELPHSSATLSQNRVFAAKFVTENTRKEPRVAHSVHIGLSAIELDIDRTRVLQGPLIPSLGTYALESSLRYVCDGKTNLVVRQDATPVSSSLSNIEKGMEYARFHDSMLYAELTPYWETSAVNLDATKNCRFGNLEVYIPQEHPVTISEFTGLIALIDGLGQRK